MAPVGALQPRKYIQPTPEQPPRHTPTAAGVQSLLKTSLAAIPGSQATREVKATVEAQLQRVDARLRAGEITPTVALGQTKVWNQHLAQSSLAQAGAQRARADEIDRMSPLQRGYEGLIGLGTGALETVQSLGQLARTANDLNPLTAASNVVAGTIVNTARTGDVRQSFKRSVDDQSTRTREALDATGRTVQGVAQLARDVDRVNPLSIATGVVADTAVGALKSGDPGAAFRQSVRQRRDQAQQSGERLLKVAGEVTGVDNIASGDPRLIGEGVFNLASLVAPYAKAKSVTGLGAVEDLVVARNNIVPFQRPLAGGVATKPVPRTDSPGVALAPEEAAVTRRRVVTLDPPTRTPGAPTPANAANAAANGVVASAAQPIASAAGGGGGARAAVTGGQVVSGGGGGRRSGLEDLEDHFRQQNGLKKKAEVVDHDRRHTLFGQPTNRRGEATINAAENSFLRDAARKDLGPTFFERKNLQGQLDEFRAGVKSQLQTKRDQLARVLDGGGDVVDLHEQLGRRLKEEGVRGVGDRQFKALDQRFDELYYQHGHDPVAYRREARKFLDEALSPPSDQALRQRFEANLSNLSAIRARNPGLTTEQLLFDPAISRQIQLATPAEVRAARDGLSGAFARLR